MKAIVIAKYGPPEGLELREVEKPVPKADELLIRIHATTVTFGDAMLRSFTGIKKLAFGLFFGLRKGKILGHELAGKIESVGSSVTRFEVGDPIFASSGTNGGAYAEYICLPDDGMLAIMPTNLTYEEAAAVPVGGNTALDILTGANINNGQKALIYGASGSVGTYAVQLAKHFGAEVTGVASTSNLDLVKSLGAEKVVDYTRKDFTKTGKTYDVVFDAVGKISESQGNSLLKTDGIYLTVSSFTKEKVENLVFLKKRIEAGELRPVIDRSYRLEQIVDAHRYVDTGHKKGNVVITVVHS